MKDDKYTILVIEPNNDWFEKISNTLSKRNYNVIRTKSSEQIVKLCLDKKPDAIIIEQDLSPSDGIEVIVELRTDASFLTLPIICYSDTSDKYTQIAAYDAGADMFIKKNVKQRLFLAIVDAVIRRAYRMIDAAGASKLYGEIELNEDQVTVTKAGKLIDLSKKEFQLLILLSTKPGKVYRREVIQKKIWGDDVIVGNRNIDTHIKKLRKKLGKEYIQTSRGLGYKFTIPSNNK